MSKNPRYSNGSARRKLRRWLRDQHRPCWICAAFGRNATIDYDLPAGHPGSFEVDELIPVSLGGDPLDKSNVDAVHRACNEWRHNKTVDQVVRLAEKARGINAVDRKAAGTVSRDW